MTNNYITTEQADLLLLEANAAYSAAKDAANYAYHEAIDAADYAYYEAIDDASDAFYAALETVRAAEKYKYKNGQIERWYTTPSGYSGFLSDLHNMDRSGWAQEDIDYINKLAK